MLIISRIKENTARKLIVSEFAKMPKMNKRGKDIGLRTQFILRRQPDRFPAKITVSWAGLGSSHLPRAGAWNECTNT